jgi:hypothetical protein
MQYLSDSLIEVNGPLALSERKLCIGAVLEMIKLAKHHVGNALPQVSSKQGLEP